MLLFLFIQSTLSNFILSSILYSQTYEQRSQQHLQIKETGTCGTSLNYTFDTNVLTINGEGSMTDYTPSNSPWNNYRTTIETLDISNGVTTIGDYAFYQCQNLRDITFPDTLQKIGQYAFSLCENLQKIIITSYVREIKDYAFYQCQNLVNVTYLGLNYLSYGNKIFGETKVDYIFVNEDFRYSKCWDIQIARTGGKCGDQTKYSIESDILTVKGQGEMEGYDVITSAQFLPPYYYYRTIIKTIIILDNVTKIGNCAFADFEILDNVTILSNVTSVGHYAFMSCSSLQNIIIPNSVTSFGQYAFSSCSSLQNFIIPTNVIIIEICLFYNCKSLQSIQIPNNVIMIRQYAFRLCSNLTNITIPESVMFINNYAFDSCSKLETVTYLGEKSPIYSTPADIFSHTNVESIFVLDKYTDNHFCNYTIAKPSGQCGPQLNYSIESGVLSIIGQGPFFNYTFKELPPYHYYRKVIHTIVISEEATNIGEYAFCELINIKKIEIPKSIESIFSNAFNRCSNLQNFTILGNIRYLGESIFYSCTLLNSISYLGEEYPSYPYSIDNYARVRCVFASEKYAYNTFGGVNVAQLKGPCGPDLQFSIDTDVLSITGKGPMFNYKMNSFPTWYYYRDMIRTIKFPEEITNISEYAFYQFTNLQNIDIPDSITIIPNYAFQFCSNLQSIIIPINVNIIGCYAFGNCTSLQSVKILGNLSKVDNYAFYQCILLSSITYLGETKPVFGLDKFYNTKVKFINVSDKYMYNSFCGIQVYQLSGPCGPNLKFHINDNVLTITGYGPMFNYTTFEPPSWGYYFRTTIDTINISKDVTSIGDVVFYEFSNIKSITILSNIIYIGDYAFYNCQNLTSFTYLGETIPSYGSYIFSYTKVRIINVSDKYPSSKFCGIQVYQLSGSCGPNLKFHIDDNVLTITGYGPMFNYTSNLLPSWNYFRTTIDTINISKDVTSIGNYAFHQMENIEYFNIPDNVTTIGSYAFQYCSKLQEIIIPERVTTIYSYAFRYCTSLQNITIPSNVTSISSYLFQYCSNLQEIIVPEQVTTICSYAFAYCSNLQNVTVLGKLESVENYAFNRCLKLNSFKYLGETVPSYGSYIFSNTNINVIDVSDKYSSSRFCDIQVYQLSGPCGPNLKFHIDDNVLTITGYGPMFNYTSNLLPSWNYFRTTIDTINIDNNTTSIGNYAFSQMENIEYFNIPDNVITIGTYAFQYCLKLQEIIIPEQVTTIYSHTFKYCISLQNVTILGNLEIIENNAFYQCFELYSFNYFGEKKPSYGSNIFYYSKITFIYVQPKYIYDEFCDIPVAKYSGYCGPTLKFNIESNSLIISGEGPMKNNTSKYFPPWYFYQENIKSISISNSATNIGDYAFYKHNALYNIIIPSNISYVGNYAFSNSINLENVTYLGKIDPLYGFDIFEGTQIQLIYVPYDYESYSFCGYKVSYLPEKITGSCGQEVTFTFESPNLTIVGQGPMYDYSPNSLPPWSTFKNSIKSVTIEEGISIIGDYSFYECVNINSINIGRSVTAIGRYAFSGCTNLQEIILPSNVTTMKDHLFSQCNKMTNIFLPNNVEIIGDYSFSFCNSLESITIPSNVQQLGQGSFTYCTSLTDINIPETITYIDSYMFSHCSNLSNITIFSELKYIGDYSFEGCSNLITIYIPKQVESIGIGAFLNCWKLTNLTIPDNIIMINNSLFSQCMSLYNITLPSKLTKIDDNAFSYCSKLNEIQIPESVINIESNAFTHCSILSEIQIPEGITSIGSHSFSYCIKLKRITIPTSLKSIFEHAFSYCSSLESINIPSHVSSIDSYSFSYCTFLQNFEFPERVSYIEPYVLYNCTKLSNITIPERVTNIRKCAFSQCISLINIEIPKRVNSIEEKAFSFCNNLQQVKYYG